MSLEYGWDISKQATERIISLPKIRRNKLIDLFDSLAKGLEDYSESEFVDQFGAIHHVATLESSVITYSVDHPVKLIHIIAIE